jgi:hypothetical protein
MPITYIYKKSLEIPDPLGTTVYPETLNVIATKTARLMHILLSGKSITARDAAFELEIFCLSSLIHYLRSYRHIPVQTRIIKKTHSNGCITRYGEYFLAASDIAEINAKKVLQ